MQKRSEICSKTAKLWKSGVAFKILGEKSTGGSQEWLQMLILINFNNNAIVKIY